jgi:hypothetical protein
MVLVGLALHGCAAGAGMALIAAGAGLAVGTGVEHTLSGIAYKTFTVSQNELRFAALKTLHRMDIKVVKDAETADHHEILAEAADRKIEIELEPLTRRATRMRVVANMGAIFFKDASTATEIILQTAQTLDTQVSAR